MHPGGSVELFLGLHVSVREGDVGLDALWRGEGSCAVFTLVYPIVVYRSLWGTTQAMR